MRSVALAALTAACCLPACQAQSTSAQSSSAQIALPALVKNFFAAEQAYDAATLARLVSPDYIEVSPAGEVDRHDRFLGFYTPDKRQPWPAMTLSDEEVRSFGTDDAIEIAKQSYTMTGPDGQPHSREIRCTFVAHREAKTWRLVGAQYTGIRPVPAPAPKP